VPESAARRNQASMNLALVELTDAWSVRERYILVRDNESLPAYAQALVEAIRSHYHDGRAGQPAPGAKSRS
jgi:hypothetical protein